MHDAKASTDVETARLLLEAARYLGETLEPQRVYERFRDLMAEAIPHDGVVVSSFRPDDLSIVCDYAWVDGVLMDVSVFPPLRLNETGGMQSQVIRTGESLLTNDVQSRVKDSGTYYDVDSEGNVKRVPDEGAPKAQAAMMIPVKHDGDVVGVVQLMSDHVSYDEQQLALAEGMVAQLGASVRNARLHEERLAAEAAAAAAQAIAAERERAARILEAVGDGIFSVRVDGTIDFWNRGAQAITGLRADAVRGKRLTELTGGWASVERAAPAAESGTRPRPVTLPVDVYGQELWLSFVAVRVPDGIVYAFRDLTPERQLEQSKHDFIATVSHELRTPMTGVLGAANTLLRDDMDLPADTRRTLLEMIANQAARLAQVTETVLLAGRLDRDEVTLQQEHIDVDTVVREAIQALEPSLALTARIEPELGSPPHADGDAARLQQVVVNLIDNAAKYSAEGSVVTVRTAERDGHVRIEVSDTGHGIAPADVPRIFEKFFRSEASKLDAPGGTGLGLYISRELVQRMGGSLEVASSPGEGSTFTVCLRVAAAE